MSNADPKGLATAVDPGTATVSATFDGLTGDTTLTVTAATLASIEVTPANPSIADGTTQLFKATGVFTDDSTQDLTEQVTWDSSNDEVATVSNADPKGLATAVDPGTATVSATFDGLTGDTTLTVTAATLASIEVTPADASIADGTTQLFKATGVFTDASTQDLTEQVTWDSSNDEVATVSNADPKGLATAVDPGTATVSATFDGLTGDTTLTVTPTLVSIAVTPAGPSIANGLTQQFTATGLYSDDSTPDITAEVTWASSNVAVATVSDTAGSKGLATAVGAGSTNVSATIDGVTDSATLTVIPSVNDLLVALLAKLTLVTDVGLGTSLVDKVTNVQDYLAVPDKVSACIALNGFTSQVSAQSGNKIDPPLADQLTADANAIKAAIPCQ